MQKMKEYLETVNVEVVISLSLYRCTGWQRLLFSKLNKLGILGAIHL